MDKDTAPSHAPVEQGSQDTLEHIVKMAATTGTHSAIHHAVMAAYQLGRIDGASQIMAIDAKHRKPGALPAAIEQAIAPMRPKDDPTAEALAISAGLT